MLQPRNNEANGNGAGEDRRGNGIPKAPGLPWLGSLPLMKNPQNFVADLYPTLGPIFRVTLLGRRWTVLAGREASRFFAESPQEIWGRRSLFHRVTSDLGTDTFIPALEGSAKEFYRRIMQLAFSRHVVTPHVPSVMQMIRDSVRGWPTTRSVSIVESLGRLASEQMGMVTANRSLKDVFEDIENLMFPMFGVPLGLLPPIALKFPSYQKRKARIFEFLGGVIEEHRGRKPGVEHPSDLVDVLLLSKGADGKPLDDASILATTVFAWASGQIYLARHYSFLLYSLLQNPEVMSRIQVEVDAVNEGGEPTVEKLRRMRWLRAANLETLRHFPIQSVMPFSIEQEFEFEGYRVKQGDKVLFAPMIAQRMPEIYPDPEAFDIDRFYEPRSEHRQKYAFTSYGVFPRNCAAMGLVEMMTLCTFSVLLYERKFEKDPPDYELDLILKPVPSPRNFALRVAEREPTHPIVDEILGSEAETSQFLKTLDDDQLEGLVGKTSTRNVERGTVIIRQGDVAEEFFVILDGEVDVFQDQPGQDHVFLRTLGKDDYFGEIGLLERCPRTATVQAREDSDVQLLVMDRDTFLDFVVGGDLIGSEIANASRRRRMSGRLASAIPTLSESRIADVVGKHELLQFAPGDDIVRQGAPSDAFFIIARGTTEVVNHAPSGEDVFLRNLVAGDYFGEIGLINDVPRTATVRAAGDSEVEVIRVDRETFLRIWNESGETKELIGRTMCERLMQSGENDSGETDSGETEPRE